MPKEELYVPVRTQSSKGFFELFKSWKLAKLSLIQCYGWFVCFCDIPLRSQSKKGLTIMVGSKNGSVNPNDHQFSWTRWILCSAHYPNYERFHRKIEEDHVCVYVYNLHLFFFLLNIGLSTEWCIMDFLWALENLAAAFIWTSFWQVLWRSPLISWLYTTVTGNNKPNSEFTKDCMIWNFWRLSRYELAWNELFLRHGSSRPWAWVL